MIDIIFGLFDYNKIGLEYHRWQVNTDFTERFKRENNMQNGFWSLNKKIGAFTVAMLLAVLLFNTTGCTQNNVSKKSFDKKPVRELSKEKVKVGNDGINAAIAPDDDVAVVSDSDKKTETENEIQEDFAGSSMVAMSIEDIGRSDPFLPDSERVEKKPKPNFGYDLLPPPETIIVDNMAQEVINTKVSGIMYDNYNPSAILNINGADYLVRSGDLVNGYKILAIAKDYVTVQKGTNVYKAGVGEMFASNSINYNTISNLEGKFGGNKNRR